MSIQWGYHFLTGIEPIDFQHEHLVALASDLQEAVASSDSDAVEAAFQEFQTFAIRHFVLEETFMAEVGMASDLRSIHEKAHTDFTAKTTELWLGRDEGRGTNELVEFIVHWTYQHILVTDHAMARQYYEITNGTPPASLLLSSGGKAIRGRNAGNQ